MRLALRLALRLPLRLPLRPSLRVSLRATLTLKFATLGAASARGAQHTATCKGQFINFNRFAVAAGAASSLLFESDSLTQTL